MPFIDTISPSEVTGEARDMYGRQQSAWGFVPNYAKVFCHRPEVMERWGRLLASIRRPQDARRFELVTFAAAHTLGNTYCTLAHGKALTEFFSEDDIVSMAEGLETEPLTDAERAMMRFAGKVARDAGAITAGDSNELKRHGFSDEEIFDIAATAAARAFFTKVLDALGAEPDSSFRRMDNEFRDTLTVGRPIGRGELEKIELT